MFGSSEVSEMIWEQRAHLLELPQLVILFISLILLATAKILQEGLIQGVFINTFKNYSFKSPINSGATFSLIANYMVVIVGLLYMFLVNYTNLDELSTSYFYGVVLLLVLLPMLNFVVAKLFIGNLNLFNELFDVSKNLILIKSILYSFLLLLWMLNDQWAIYFKWAILILITIFYLLRIALYLSKSFKHHVSWYYLILYFCTLEILPYAFFLVSTLRILRLERIV